MNEVLAPKSKRLKGCNVLLLMPIFLFYFSLWNALRPALLGADAVTVERNFMLGTLYGLIVMAMLGVIYIRSDWLLNWQLILVTMYLTALLMAVLYIFLSDETVLWLVSVMDDALLQSRVRRMILGGLDGITFGGTIGIIISAYNVTTGSFLTWRGLLRYGALYMVIALALSSSVLFHLSNALGLFVMILFVVAAFYAINRYL